jgi:DNA invertase Pin-like site-specific DNA recombinase
MLTFSFIHTTFKPLLKIGGHEMEQKRAFGYLRVSGKGQVNGDGFDRQEQSILDYAKDHNILIEKIYREEGVSGAQEKRPALAELIISLEQNGHGIQTVIIEKMDRLARDLMIQEIIVADFKKKGFELISVHEGEDLLTEDPTRKLIRQVMGAIAEYDKTMTVLKLRVARERKRLREGKCEGRKGYSDFRSEDYYEQLMREIKQLRRKHKGQNRKPFTQVAKELNNQKWETPSGKPFSGQIVQNLLRK